MIAHWFPDVPNSPPGRDPLLLAEDLGEAAEEVAAGEAGDGASVVGAGAAGDGDDASLVGAGAGTGAGELKGQTMT